MSVVENSAAVWHSRLTSGEELSIERIQRCALRIVLKDEYENYSSPLSLTGLDTSKERRLKLCKNFARKCVKSGKHTDMFPLNSNPSHTRRHEKYQVTNARTDRLADSAIPFMHRLLNSEENNQYHNQYPSDIVSFELLLIISHAFEIKHLSKLGQKQQLGKPRSVTTGKGGMLEITFLL